MNGGMRRRIGIGVLALVILAAGLWLASGVIGGAKSPPEIQGVILPEGRPLGTFQLVDHQGQPFTETDFRGRWSLVFFGYTHCPDVCPASLSILSRVWQWLDDQPELKARSQVVFVTVDPERDTPERLAEYLPHFHPDFRGVTGSHEALSELAGHFAVAHTSEGLEEGIIDHTAATLLVGPEGQWRALFSAGTPPGTLAQDFVRVTRYLDDRS